MFPNNFTEHLFSPRLMSRNGNVLIWMGLSGIFDTKKMTIFMNNPYLIEENIKVL